MDDLVRTAAFKWLREQCDRLGDVLPRSLLAQGFQHDDRRVPLLGPQGIFKPKIMGWPLSITTAFDGPYADVMGPLGLEYRYRGSNPAHRDNVGLRELMQGRAPLVYFHALAPGRYLAWWPVYVVGDEPSRLTFTVAVDDATLLSRTAASDVASKENETTTTIRRQYVTSMATRRLHQAAFRERVLDAYRSQCALCRLRHEALLDAAHIIPDSEELGDPIVANGVALCKLHHAAYDRFFLSIRPDYVIEIRRSLMEESDGPMLRHALQELRGQRILLPGKIANRPDPERLSIRHEQFLEAAEL